MGIVRFYFAFDGPRDEIETLAQDNFVSYLQNLCFRLNVNFYISRLSINCGIFVNMVSALEWFFKENDYGIILEDDTIPDLSFIDFVITSRKFLDNNAKTLLISGWRGSHLKADLQSEGELSSYPLIWGWASSREKWQIMREWFFGGNRIISSYKYFFTPSYGFWRVGLKRSLSGKLDSWANVLAYNFLVGGYHSYVVPNSQVTNVGFDSLATNSRDQQLLNSKEKHLDSTITLDDWLKRYVFNIKRRHAFAPIYAPFIDFFRKGVTRDSPIKILKQLGSRKTSGLELRRTM